MDELLREGSLVLIFLWVMGGGMQESRIVSVIRSSAMIAVCIGVLIYVFQPVNRFVGTFFDPRFHTDYWPNAWAEFLLLAWPLFLPVSGERASPLGGVPVRSKSLYHTLRFGVLLSALLLSYSRGAVLVFVLQLLMLFFVHLRMLGSAGVFRRLRSVLPGICTSVLLAVLFFSSVNALRARLYPVQSVTEKVTFTAPEGASSVDERMQFWEQAFILNLRHPFLGYGPYSFRFVQPKLQEGVLATSDHPHNVFLKLAMERGFPAAALFLLVFVFVLFPIFPNDLSRMNGGDMAMALSVVGVLLHNMIDYNLQFIGIALPLWVLLGLLARSRHRAPATIPKIRRPTEILLATFLMVLAVVQVPDMLLSSLGRRAERAGNFAAAERWYAQARHQSFSRDLHLSRAHVAMTLGHAPLALDALQTVLRLNPHDARAWKRMAELMRISGKEEEALAYAETAFALGKWNDVGIVLLYLQALHDRGDEEGIQARKDVFDAMLQHFTVAIRTNAHFIALSHNVEDFLTLSGLMAEIFLDSAPRYHVLSAEVDRHAREERTKVRSRPPGYLW